MENKVLNRKISQLIITFAFFYSAIICHFKAIQFYNNQNFLMAYFLWFCAITSFLGALRFQIAKIVEKLRKLKND
jgi:hypothetical protein